MGGGISIHQYTSKSGRLPGYQVGPRAIRIRKQDLTQVMMVVITNNQRFPSRLYRVLLSITNAVDTPSGESLRFG